MNKSALAPLLAVSALAGAAAESGVRRRGRPRETIDDVLARARRNKDKPAFDPTLDGRKQGPDEVEGLLERFGSTKGTEP